MSNKLKPLTLIQNDLPKLSLTEKIHSHGPSPTIEPPKSSSEKQWRHLKSELNSALSQWSELENVEKKKTPEEEQLEKMRGLLSNLKDRLLEF